MRAIYTITCLGKGGIPKRRCCGWYRSFKDAEYAVLHNHTDMFECGYYDLAVIEKMEEGLMPMECVNHQFWYSAKYNPKAVGRHKLVTKVKRLKHPPMEYANTFAFSMG